MARPKPKRRDRIAKLEDELKERDQRIRDLRNDLNKADALVGEMREHVQDANALIESWIESFDMQKTDKGLWEWSDNVIGGDYCSKYIELMRQWNRFVPEYNAIVTASPRNVGRPLAASDAQRDAVLNLRKSGMSLRGIAEETSLGLQTVRTIIDQPERRDRTTRKYLERITDRPTEVRWRARKRTRDSLPKRINMALENGRDLAKRAGGGKSQFETVRKHVEKPLARPRGVT
jgi:hypothetical protein